MRVDLHVAERRVRPNSQDLFAGSPENLGGSAVFGHPGPGGGIHAMWTPFFSPSGAIGPVTGSDSSPTRERPVGYWCGTGRPVATIPRSFRSVAAIHGGCIA